MSRFNRHSRGFSMIELMIAIMILGIGMTMVATVFPIAMNMTRDTLQMSISLAAADAAVATAKLKLPKAEDITGDGTKGNNCLVPQRDIKAIEIEGAPPAEINGPEDQVIKFTDSISNPPINPTDVWDLPFPNWKNDWLDLDNYIAIGSDPPKQDLIDYTRVFTELTGWDAEVNLDYPQMTFVVPAQNIIFEKTTGQLSLRSEISPTMGARPLIPMPGFHLADRVYPPVEVTYRNGEVKEDSQIAYEVASGLVVDTASPPNTQEDEPNKARRYSWTIIHRQPAYQNPADHYFWLTIVVTHRGDLTNRYARQTRETPKSPYSDNVFFDLTDPNELIDLLKPVPDDLTTDMLFPRPWLVILNSISPSTGTVTCTAEVARLLPRGSTFIIAGLPPPSLPPQNTSNLCTGTAHKVLERNWDWNELGKDSADQRPSVLRIATSVGGKIENIPVWVFPPAIDRVGSRVIFREHSPVVGVFMREVAPE